MILSDTIKNNLKNSFPGVRWMFSKTRYSQLDEKKQISVPGNYKGLRLLWKQVLPHGKSPLPSLTVFRGRKEVLKVEKAAKKYGKRYLRVLKHEIK